MKHNRTSLPTAVSKPPTRRCSLRLARSTAAARSIQQMRCSARIDVVDAPAWLPDVHMCAGAGGIDGTASRGAGLCSKVAPLQRPHRRRPRRLRLSGPRPRAGRVNIDCAVRDVGGSLRRAARVAGAQRPNGGAAGGEAGGRRRRGDGGCAGRGAAAVPGNQTPQPRQVLLSTHVSLPP